MIAPTHTETSSTRTFMLVTIAGSLVAWDIGFEFGAFDTVSYRRVFAVFVVSTVVLVATIIADDDTLATSNMSRAILALPLLYFVADLTFLTFSQLLVSVLSLAILLTFPWALWVIARMLDTDFFSLGQRERNIAVATVILIGLAGLYVGTANDRFLTCGDFERIGDYQPDNCRE